MTVEQVEKSAALQMEMLHLFEGFSAAHKALMFRDWAQTFGRMAGFPEGQWLENPSVVYHPEPIKPEPNDYAKHVAATVALLTQ
jgi:hypothetical protein